MTIKKMYKGNNSENVQQQNRLLVLRLIRRFRETSRVMLAEETGLKQATITNIVNDLLELGYVKEIGLIEGANGRRVKGISLNAENLCVLVARFNSDYYAIGSYDLNGDCIKVEKKFWDEKFKFDERLDILSKEFLYYRDIITRGKKVLGAGIVLQGSITGENIEFVNNMSEDIERYMEKFFSEILEMSVYVDNMSNMSAFFEWDYLNQTYEDNHMLICLMVGYSVDCAIISDGRIVLGGNGRAGHYGHVSIDVNGPECECGNCGCVKNYISVSAVKKRVAELNEQYPNSIIEKESNIRDIIQAFYGRDELACQLYEEIAETLGVIVTNLINQFNPEEIILGDEIPNDDIFCGMIQNAVKKRIPKHRYERVRINMFKTERKTQYDVGLRGMSLFVITEQLKKMKLK